MKTQNKHSRGEESLAQTQGRRKKQRTKTSGLVFRPVARKQALNNGHFDTDMRAEERRKTREVEHFRATFSPPEEQPDINTLPFPNPRQNATGSHLCSALLGSVAPAKRGSTKETDSFRTEECVRVRERGPPPPHRSQTCTTDGQRVSPFHRRLHPE